MHLLVNKLFLFVTLPKKLYFCNINRLAQHIEVLLTEHTCVVVPGFGGFVLQHFSAKWEGDTLLAPYMLIVFNAQLTHDDATLVQAYMRTLRVKYVEAKQQVYKDVALLKSTLAQTSAVQFGRIGTLRLREQTILFTPSTGAFLPDNFGMQPIQATLRKPFVQSTITSTNSSITFTLQRTTLRRVAACLVGIALLALVPTSQENSYTQYASLAPVNFAQIIEERNAAIEASRLAELAAEEKAVERGHFHVIVSTLEKNSAENLCQRLQVKGYSDAILLEFKRNQYRVAIASYQTKKEALREMRKVRNATSYKRAWVYCEPINR